MSGREVQDFLDRFKLSDRAAEQVFGVSRATIKKYREEGAPKVFALACSAIAFDLPPYRRGAAVADQRNIVDWVAHRRHK